MLTVTVLNQTTAELVGTRIDCATTMWTRLAGLLSRHNLESGEGLWIIPSSGVHTFGMKFTIDVVGLDANLQVVRLWPRLAPHRVTSISARVRSVLELAEGEICAHSIRIGDQLSIIRTGS